MKYLLFVIAAGVPILFLSGKSLTDVFSGSGDPGAGDVGLPEAKCADVQAQAGEQAAAAEAARADCEPIWKCDLATAPLPVADGVAEPQVKDYLTRLATAKYAATMYAMYASQPALLAPDLSKKDSVADVAALKESAADLKALGEKLLAKAAEVKRSPGIELPAVVDPLVADLDARKKACEAQVVVLEKRDMIEKAIEDVRNRLSKTQYGEARLALEKPPLSDNTDEKFKEAIDKFVIRAKFGEEAASLLNTAKLGVDPGILAKILAFLDRHREPPDEAERSLYEELRKIAMHLQHRAKLDEITNAGSIEAALALADAMYTATEINGTGAPNDVAATRAEIKQRIVKWLTDKGPKELDEPQALRGGLQEAIVIPKDQPNVRLRLIGYYKAYTIGTPPETVGHHFLPSNAPNQGSGELYRKSQFDPKTPAPGIPFYLGLRTKYNNAVRTLTGRTGTREGWAQFASDCDTWRGELEDYRNGIMKAAEHAADTECRSWSFTHAKTVADGITANWDKYAKIMGN